MIKKISILATLTLFAGFFVASSVKADTLETIKTRGSLKCGVNSALAGFSAPDADGKWVGIDADVCRAVAAAIFGDANKVTFTALTAQQRFTALQSGEVDLLSRNTTLTFQREAALGLLFTQVIYYDGQGFIVKKSSGIKDAKQLDKRTVCVQPGTTTELNLADFARNFKITVKPVVIEKFEDSVAAYMSGRCDAYTTDASGLAAIRATAKNPSEHVILKTIISKEPLAPAVRQGDDKFYNIVNWTIRGMLNAEEFGVSKANVMSKVGSTDSQDVKRLLDSEIAPSLGLEKDFIVKVISQVGNYEDIFEANVGKKSKLGLERGLNALWNKGGLQYSPPFR